MIIFWIQIISTLFKSAVSVSCKAVIIPVADPDLQIRGGGGGLISV